MVSARFACGRVFSVLSFLFSACAGVWTNGTTQTLLRVPAVLASTSCPTFTPEVLAECATAERIRAAAALGGDRPKGVGRDSRDSLESIAEAKEREQVCAPAELLRPASPTRLSSSVEKGMYESRKRNVERR